MGISKFGFAQTKEKYDNSSIEKRSDDIVFIGDSKEIITHDTAYDYVKWSTLGGLTDNERALLQVFEDSGLSPVLKHCPISQFTSNLGQRVAIVGYSGTDGEPEVIYTPSIDKTIVYVHTTKLAESASPGNKASDTINTSAFSNANIVSHTFDENTGIGIITFNAYLKQNPTSAFFCGTNLKSYMLCTQWFTQSKFGVNETANRGDYSSAKTVVLLPPKFSIYGSNMTRLQIRHETVSNNIVCFSDCCIAQNSSSDLTKETFNIYIPKDARLDIEQDVILNDQQSVIRYSNLITDHTRYE